MIGYVEPVTVMTLEKALKNSFFRRLLGQVIANLTWELLLRIFVMVIIWGYFRGFLYIFLIVKKLHSLKYFLDSEKSKS